VRLAALASSSPLSSRPWWVAEGLAVRAIDTTAQSAAGSSTPQSSGFNDQVEGYRARRWSVCVPGEGNGSSTRPMNAVDASMMRRPALRRTVARSFILLGCAAVSCAAPQKPAADRRQGTAPPQAQENAVLAETRRAASQGDAAAQYRLGVMCAKGQGVRPRPKNVFCEAALEF
jgi:hypothetical protein